MKVVFIYPDLSKGARGKFYHGVAFLSAVLKQAGHQTALIHVISPMTEKDLSDAVRNESPDLVGFSTTTHMFPYVYKYAAAIKKVLPVPIVCGGVHATLAPEEVIACENIDIVCIGEGEQALVELCERMSKRMDINDIKNLWIKKNRVVHKNPVRPRLQNLDTLPFPDRTIFNYEQLVDAQMKRHVFMASRGCPYDCSYCCNLSIRAVSEGRYTRFRSVNNVLAEIKQVLAGHKVEHIAFHDDLFTLNEKWLREFSLKYKKEVGLPFVCNSRVRVLDESRVETLKEAGCRRIELGIESGNVEIRENLLNRRMSNEEIVKAFELCQKYGIETYSYNMIGLPFETMDKILDTVKLNARVGPDVIQVSIFYPYPHTKLFDICIENQMLTGRNFESYFEDTILAQPGITRDQVIFAFYNFEFLVVLYSAIWRLPRFVASLLEAILDRLFVSCNVFVPPFNKPLVVATLTHFRKGGIMRIFKRFMEKLNRGKQVTSIL